MTLNNALCTPEQFRDALRKGLGRAVEYVRTTPAELVRKPLLYACTHYLGYDMQCEGSRTPWLHKMTVLTGEPGWYCTEALKELEKYRDYPEDSRSLYELVHLLALFAQNGFPEVKPILRRRFFDFKPPDGDVLCTDLPLDILETEGAVALLGRYGQMEDRDYAASIGSYLLADGDEKFGLSLADAIRRARNDDNALDAYLRDIEKYRQDEEEDKRQRHDSPLVPTHLLSIGPVLERMFSFLDNIPPAKGRTLTDEAFRDEYVGLQSGFKHEAGTPNRHYTAPPQFFEQVFERLLMEDDPGRQYCLLGAFYHRPMPHFEPRILELMDSPISMLQQGAATAFANMSTPEIRAKGRELLEAMPERAGWENGFVLLTGSGQPDDLPLIIATLHAAPLQTMSAFDVHGIVWKVQPLVVIAEPIDSAPIMLWTYENSPCANCRRKSITWLIENNIVPVELLKECLDDCDDQTRAIAMEVL
jgi:hypothetical protein